MAYVGYEYVRSSLDLPIFEVRRPALVKPVTRIMSSADALGVPAAMVPADGDLVAHLLFALKHEGVNLQVLAGASKHLARADLAAALAATPNGQYVRMTQRRSRPPDSPRRARIQSLASESIRPPPRALYSATALPNALRRRSSCACLAA